ncbi:hypothetical protein Vadar_006149 [Vaccinium darrowii]|uniref:Uncharacterized protein n=1 Tax=Vaccinium darrowii TaxID=229202 RepID=A0ACB7ZHL3_9ERIC|nr:hypothetical protein Vadar_006149 [Vaccinium darrowii]
MLLTVTHEYSGGCSWICEGEYDFISTSCIRGTIICGLNMLFLLAFYLCLVIGYLRKNDIGCFGRRDSVTIAISICSAVISIAYLGSSLWDVITQNRGSSKLSWMVHLIRGLIWMSLTFSLLLRGSKWLQILASVWWVLFFLLTSALNTEALFRRHDIENMEMAAWVVNLLLLFCALRNFSYFFFQHASEQNLSEPLLAVEPEAKRSRLGQDSFLSKLTFSWINPLLQLGYSKILALEDIPSLVPEDESVLAYEKFTRAWDLIQSSNNTGNLVIWALVKVHMKEMVYVGICAFLRALSAVVSPLLLYAFVNYSNRKTESTQQGLYLVACLVAVKVVESLTQRHFLFTSRRTGMKMRSALMVAVYRKQLNLSSLGRERHSTGEIMNYIAVDCYRMGEFPIPTYVCGLLNVPFAKFLQKCQFQFMIAQDQRLRSMSEILNTMKIIKLQSWEEKFKKLIDSYRENEFKWLAETQYTKAYGTALYWMCPTIVSSVVFFGCALTGSASLDAATIFTILATLRSMSDPVKMIPETISAMIQVKVSFDRIESFLIADELRIEKLTTVPSRDSNMCIKIQAGKFSWDPESAIPTLRNIDLEVQRGQKIAICGPVGAGKSSVLYAMLGEIPRSSGSVTLFGSIAYVSQASWIQSGTICDNILYGKPMEETKYKRAVKACALDKDINNFDYGDLTEIGQRGLNMSGGQKQRIQLARAVYSDADIYLLDDPFSAVDAHTAATLFNDCVMAALQKKTVILVTHQVEFLSQVNKILVIQGGEVTQSGCYEELLTRGTAFEQLVNAHRNEITAIDPEINENTPNSLKEHMDGVEETKGPYLTKENTEGEISVKGLPGVQLTVEEEKEIGNVRWKPIFDYIIIPKGFLFLSLSILSQSGFVILQAASSYWLAFGSHIPTISSGILIGVYTVISTISAIFVYLRSYLSALLGLKASKSFFSNFINSIFNAPMLFFDSTPVGRILTRASSDLSTLDFDIPFSLTFLYCSTIEALSVIVIMASITWQVLIVAVFATVASIYVQGYYLASARELTRINGTTKAPVMNYAAETSHGGVTIRAFNMAERFFQNYLKLIDTDAKLSLYSNAAMEWLILRVEALQNLTLFTGAFLLMFFPKGDIAPVSITRWYSSICNYMISVERIKQYMHIPPEPPAIVEDKRPPSSWPSKGRIELQDLKIRYRLNAPLVLKGITCTFREGDRVGVVGRTGSGKTTLISALFRLVEPDSGKILIDGLDICSIGLKDLRLKLSIIPQEPTLFRGSVRTNLDPLGLYSDDEIWKALEKCQLKATISSLPKLLDSSVSEEGENWSAGQRQLFCLGRVLLKRNRILVLDEATASIDSATDAILQSIIREEFSDCTVITVAHRVPTVIDSNMVMVLSFGFLAVLVFDLSNTQHRAEDTSDPCQDLLQERQKTYSVHSLTSSDSVPSGSFANLKLTAEKLVKEQASAKTDLELANTKMKKLTEHIHALEEKLQNAFNENAKLRVKQKEDEKLWKGLESKFTSTKTLCDQLTETLQHLAGQVHDAEKDKKFFEDKLSSSASALDNLHVQMQTLSLKLETSEETVRNREKELKELTIEKVEGEKSFRMEQCKASNLIEEKDTTIKHLEATVAANRLDMETLNSKMEVLHCELRFKGDDLKHLRTSKEMLETEKSDLLTSNKDFASKLDKALQEIRNLEDFANMLAAKLIELDKQSLTFSDKVVQLNSLYDSWFKMVQEEKDLTSQCAKKQYDHLHSVTSHVISEKNELLLLNKELNNNIVEVQKGQEFAMVQHAEECRLAEERIRMLESEAESNLSRKSELELLVSKSEEKINTLSESARLSDTKMQDLILKFTALEAESKDSTEILQDEIQKKVEEVNSLQGDIDRHVQHLDALEKQVDKLQTTLEEKEQLVLLSKDTERELEDKKAELQAALVDAESKLSEAKMQYDSMLESKQLELSRHLKELSQRNDQAINDIRRKFEVEKLESVTAEKEKADKVVQEMERKCDQKLAEHKEESHQYLIRLQEEHAALITRIQQEHSMKELNLKSNHSDELKRIQLQTENELREKTTLLRNEHEVQIRALKCQHEDECRKLQEELDIQKSKEDRQRALLQLQWKVMSDKSPEDQEVNSKKNYSVSSTKVRNSDGGRRSQRAPVPLENEPKNSPYVKATQTPVSTLLKKVEKVNTGSVMSIPKHSRKVTHREYEVETSNGRTITKRRKTKSTVMFEDPTKRKTRTTPKVNTPRDVHKGMKGGNPHPSNIGDLFSEGSLNPYADDPYAFD